MSVTLWPFLRGDDEEGIWQEWANRQFGDRRQLRQHTYFWTKDWGHDDIGLYHDFGIPLEQLEYQVIGLISDLYADRFLNEEGV